MEACRSDMHTDKGHFRMHSCLCSVPSAFACDNIYFVQLMSYGSGQLCHQARESHSCCTCKRTDVRFAKVFPPEVGKYVA